MNTRANILLKAAKIKLAIFDVDGVFTDGRLYFDAQGEALKVFHVQDGLGVKLLQQSGVAVAVISGRESASVTQRLKEINVEFIYQGRENKQQVLTELLTQLKLTTEQVVYVGDDLPDLPLIQQVGLGICVPNAHPLLKEFAGWQTTSLGGYGAVREVCELIMEAQNTLSTAHAAFLLK